MIPRRLLGEHSRGLIYYFSERDRKSGQFVSIPGGTRDARNEMFDESPVFVVTKAVSVIGTHNYI